MKDLKDQTVPISISTLVSLAAVVGFAWVIIKPTVIKDVREELMTEIDSKITTRIVEEQRPLRTAYKEILQSGINVNKRAIAKLEYDRDHAPDSWSAERAAVLADRYIEVQAQERAYNAL